ncbi:MAG: molybdenum cofactor guanylyltransferase MobA [Casimicrobium sp.]
MLVRSTSSCPVTGLILAGGMGRRMDSRDKGLVPFKGKPMVQHAIERLARQVNDLIVNANRNVQTYASFGYSVVSDELSGFAGPLAGLHVGIRASASRSQEANSQWIATVPCDSPMLPLDLVQRLFEAAQNENAEIAVAVTSEGAQPVFALYKLSLLESLETFLSAGERKIDKWTAQHRVANVMFDDASAFANINTSAELSALQDDACSG